jgi:hypothetical protein
MNSRRERAAGRSAREDGRPHIGTVCDAIRQQDGAADVRRILGALGGSPKAWPRPGVNPAGGQAGAR